MNEGRRLLALYRLAAARVNLAAAAYVGERPADKRGYFAALEPARPAPARPEPKATLTLVRWPYT